MAAYRLVINPESDRQFAAHVYETARPDMKDPSELEGELRRRFPEAVVHNGVTEPDGRKRWYVYRDGRWGAQRSSA